MFGNRKKYQKQRASHRLDRSGLRQVSPRDDCPEPALELGTAKGKRKPVEGFDHEEFNDAAETDSVLGSSQHSESWIRIRID